jgi:hypothetical protein
MQSSLKLRKLGWFEDLKDQRETRDSEGDGERERERERDGQDQVTHLFLTS